MAVQQFLGIKKAKVNGCFQKAWFVKGQKQHFNNNWQLDFKFFSEPLPFFLCFMNVELQYYFGDICKRLIYSPPLQHSEPRNRHLDLGPSFPGWGGSRSCNFILVIIPKAISTSYTSIGTGQDLSMLRTVNLLTVTGDRSLNGQYLSWPL